MTNARSDGRIFLALGILSFILFGIFFRFHATDSMLDFQEVYCGARLLVQHHDPYDPTWMSNIYTQLGESKFVESHKPMIFSVYLPTGYLVLAPIAALPWKIASVLWNILISGSLITAACLMWQISADFAPVLSGAFIGFALVNGAVVFANGNPAGVVVGLCVIAAWCIIQERLVWAGILCLVVGLALKPQDAGLIWLFFLLRPGTFRKRAIQIAAITFLLWAVAVLWTSHVAPHWLSEFRSNFALWAGRGGNSDPGPTGLTSKTGTIEVITCLQTVISVIRDSPAFYNSITFLFCGLLLLVWAITTIRSNFSTNLTWTALATVVPLSLLVTYHRAYDGRLLILAIPTCAMLWARRGASAKFALAVTALAFFFTAEIPLAFINPLTRHLHPAAGSALGKLEIILFLRPAALCLLAMSLFYLWIYVREYRSATASRTPALADK